MKYNLMPWGMWALFENSFEDELTGTMGLNKVEAAMITAREKKDYRRIIKEIPEFEKGDRFKVNIISCAMLCSFILNLKERPSVELMSKYYEKAMMIRPMRWFCKEMGKRKFSAKDIEGMKKTASFNAADRNPYSWNMDFLPYEDDSGYEARFYKCGICTLMKKLGLQEYTVAMCHLDYVMSEAGGVSDFVREYTLASGGPYCDCGYKKKPQ